MPTQKVHPGDHLWRRRRKRRRRQETVSHDHTNNENTEFWPPGRGNPKKSYYFMVDDIIVVEPSTGSWESAADQLGFPPCPLLSGVVCSSQSYSNCRRCAWQQQSKSRGRTGGEKTVHATGYIMHCNDHHTLPYPGQGIY